MSTTVEINSSGWTLTTFSGGAMGRAYELTIPGREKRIFSEAELSDFFDILPEDRAGTEQLEIARRDRRPSKKRNITWHMPIKDNGEHYPDPVWPEGWPIPPINSSVYIDGDSLKVRAVDFFPQGEEEGDEPSIYVVLHSTRTVFDTLRE